MQKRVLTRLARCAEESRLKPRLGPAAEAASCGQFTDRAEPRVHSRLFLRAVAAQEGARILEIGMVRTHVHLLVRIHPTTVLSRLLQRLKGGSAAIAGKERHTPPDNRLRWANGYSIRSVSPRSLDAVRNYLRAQPEHHP